MAAGPGGGPGAPSEAEAAQLCRSLEVGTVMTLFYSKKSQRPERKTFQVKLETRQVTWSRGSEKVEGAGECGAGELAGRGGRGAALPRAGVRGRSPPGSRRSGSAEARRKEKKIEK